MQTARRLSRQRVALVCTIALIASAVGLQIGGTFYERVGASCDRQLPYTPYTRCLQANFIAERRADAWSEWSQLPLLIAGAMTLVAFLMPDRGPRRLWGALLVVAAFLATITPLLINMSHVP